MVDLLEGSAASAAVAAHGPGVIEDVHVDDRRAVVLEVGLPHLPEAPPAAPPSSLSSSAAVCTSDSVQHIGCTGTSCHILSSSSRSCCTRWVSVPPTWGSCRWRRVSPLDFDLVHGPCSAVARGRCEGQSLVGRSDRAVGVVWVDVPPRERHVTGVAFEGLDIGICPRSSDACPLRADG